MKHLLLYFTPASTQMSFAVHCIFEALAIIIQHLCKKMFSLYTV